MSYRDSNSHAAPANENDDWQDWPPETSSTSGSGMEAIEWLTKWADEPIAREYRPSRLPAPLIPSGRVPASPPKPAAQPAADHQKRRWSAAKRVALVLGMLLVLAAGAWYGHYWWTTVRL